MTNDSGRMIALLDAIGREQALARIHDAASADSAAQAADERAEAARDEARGLVEAAFPGISWTSLRRALL